MTTLKLPNGKPAGLVDRVMVLALWTKQIEMYKAQYDKEDIFVAGIGRPTYPLNLMTTESALEYWTALNLKRQSAAQVISRSSANDAWPRSELSEIQAVIGYGEPQGELPLRKKMAMAMSNWYKVPISPEDVLFNVGGAGALHTIFEFIHQISGEKQIPIITPFPHYSLYTWKQRNKLSPINLFDLPGYRLTAKALKEALLNAATECDKKSRMVFLLCDPHNPLGIALRESEFETLIEVLYEFPNTLIVLDEAYAEMRFVGNTKISLLSTAYRKHPEMIKRFIVMRSATKALSAAGERMAITLAFDPNIMLNLLENNINICGHAPISLQHAYTGAMLTLSSLELTRMCDHYKPQVELVYNRIHDAGLQLPDLTYMPDGTFYIVLNLSALFGQPTTEKMHEAIDSETLLTDEDIAYYLLFEHGIMITPLSYFGVAPTLGYLRITCVGGDTELSKLMDKIEDVVKRFS